MGNTIEPTPSVADLPAAVMPADEAARLTAEIDAALLRVDADLGEFEAKMRAVRDERGWAALGHESWDAYCVERRGTTRRNINRLLAKGDMIERLELATGTRVSHPDLSARDVETLTKTPGLHRKIKQRINAGADPVGAIKGVAAEARRRPPPVVDVTTSTARPRDELDALHADLRSASDALVARTGRALTADLHLKHAKRLGGPIEHPAPNGQPATAFEAAPVAELASLGKPRLVAVQRKINEALRVVR